MRVFVFLLILANLLFLAWTQGYFGSSSDPDSLRVSQQLLADQVIIVARDEPPAEAAKPEKNGKAAEKKPTDVCLQLADLQPADADQMEARLADKFPAFKAARTTVAGTASYWVHIPPLASKQEADTKVAELKKLGVAELFIVQESGPNNRAISLGLYSKKDAATAYLEALRAKGVKSAKMLERNGKPSSASLEIHGPEAQADALRQAITELLPESKPAVCKPPAAP